jgi:hypothetical protein
MARHKAPRGVPVQVGKRPATQRPADRSPSSSSWAIRMYGQLRPRRTPGNPRQPTGCGACPSRSGSASVSVGRAPSWRARAARLQAALKTYRKFAQSAMVIGTRPDQCGSTLCEPSPRRSPEALPGTSARGGCGGRSPHMWGLRGSPPGRAQWTSRPVGRVLSLRSRGVAVIHLGLPLPAASSGLPAGSGRLPSNACAGPLSRALLDLAPGGVYLATPVAWGAGGLLHHRFTLTSA